MESKGYQLVEPGFTGAWSMNKVDTGVYVSILCWLVDTIGAREALHALPVSLELIVVTYVAPCPCMALHYPDPEATADISPLVEAWCEELLNGAGFRAYFDYVTTHSARIAEFVKHHQAACAAYYAHFPADPTAAFPGPKPSAA